MFSLPNIIKQLGSLTALLLTILILQGCDNATNDVLLSSNTSTISEPIDDHIAAAPFGYPLPPIVKRNLDRASSAQGQGILGGPARPARTILTTLGVVDGGDPMTSGSMRINNINGRVRVDLTGSHALNLYEIYWVAPSATSLTADAICMGNIVTDGAGTATGELLRDIATYADIAGATPVNTKARKMSGGHSPFTRGWFLFFSRGPYPPGSFGTFPNPPVNLTPTIGDSTSFTQYISTGLRRLAK